MKVRGSRASHFPSIQSSACPNGKRIIIVLVDFLSPWLEKDEATRNRIG